MYPPLRVFDVVTKSANFSLPGEGVAHPSPYLYIDSTDAEVDGSIDASTFIYAAELVIVKFGGTNPAAIVAPDDWLTPGATLLPTFDTADFGASWRVLVDGIKKVVIVLSAPSGGGGGSSNFLLKFSGILDMGTNAADTYGDYPGDTGRGGLAVGYPLPHATTFTALYLSRTANTANQPQSYIILKNNALTALILPGQVGGVTGVSHIGAQSVGFAENDLLDFAAAPDSGGGSGQVKFSAMLIGSVDA